MDSFPTLLQEIVNWKRNEQRDDSLENAHLAPIEFPKIEAKQGGAGGGGAVPSLDIHSIIQEIRAVKKDASVILSSGMNATTTTS